jgi:hypothetical protein
MSRGLCSRKLQRDERSTGEMRDPVNVSGPAGGVGSVIDELAEATMNAPNSPRAPANLDLEVEDLTQEIDAPLDDLVHYRDEPTLSRLDFEDIEIALDL